MNKAIIVNDVAASYGGALSILRQFLNEIANNTKAKRYDWYIFVSNGLIKEYNSDYIKIIKVDVKPWRKRIIWDTVGVNRWLKKHEVKPILAISLMSVGLKYFKLKQIVYIHQPLPFGDFNHFKWFELKPIVYKYLIFIWMKWTIDKQSQIIVQTNWMKESVSKKIKINPENITVIRPEIAIFSDTIVNKKKKGLTFSYRLFYPSTPTVSYKNYDILFKFFKELKKKAPKLGNRLKIVLTCSKDDKGKLVRHYLKRSKNLQVDNNLIWAGYLNQEEMDEYYLNCDGVVFPSLLETFGLPLVEAAAYGKKIFAQDKPYARDVLKNYEGVSFVENNEDAWADEVIAFYASPINDFGPLSPSKGEWSRFMEIVFKMISFNQ